MKRKFLFIFSVFLSLVLSAQYSFQPDYMQQKLPGNAPVLFAPGIVSDGFANRDFTISPDGNEILYTIQQKDFISVIMEVKKVNGKWLSPQVVSFSGKYNDLEATFTHDGKRIFFSSNRPINPADSTNDFNIWYTEKKNGAWAEPVALSGTVNTSKDEYYPSLSKNGNLYYTTVLEGGKGKEDIVMSEWKNGQYQPPVSLSEAINSKGYEFNAFVDPDEQYILFTGYGRTDEFGKGDLYISVRKNGEWQPAINLGKQINGPYFEYCPFVTWDKKYLFFTSPRISYTAPFSEKQNFGQLKKGLQSAGNGLDDIYWVRFDTLLANFAK